MSLDFDMKTLIKTHVGMSKTLQQHQMLLEIKLFVPFFRLQVTYDIEWPFSDAHPPQFIIALKQNTFIGNKLIKTKENFFRCSPTTFYNCKLYGSKTLSHCCNKDTIFSVCFTLFFWRYNCKETFTIKCLKSTKLR